MKTPEHYQYKSLIEQLNDAVYTVNFDSLNFTSANKAAEKLTGYSRKELLSMTVAQIIVPEYLPTVKKMISLKAKNEQSTIYEIEIIQKNGHHIPVEISSLALYNLNKPVEILGVARNIKERKEIEQQRNIFISLISHEIKNPLTTINGYLEILKRHLKNDSKSLNYLQTISRQTDSINNLMNDFLDITQMKVGKFRIFKEPFDLNLAIKEVMEAHNSDSGEIMLKGKVKTIINADRNRICQVITNLLSNSIKYGSDGEPIIISVKENTKELIVQIADSGPGIPKSEQKQIFDLFVRTRGALNSKTKGHGLGLFICREIITLHKGKIWLESIPGQGSTFSFSLPKH